MTCKDCVYSPICKVYADFGVTDLPYDENDTCEMFKSKSDLVEVVHGEWVHIKDCGGGKCSGHCSVCWTPQEAAFPSALKEGFRYCRWCGAKMDGRKDV